MAVSVWHHRISIQALLCREQVYTWCHTASGAVGSVGTCPMGVPGRMAQCHLWVLPYHLQCRFYLQSPIRKGVGVINRSLYEEMCHTAITAVGEECAVALRGPCGPQRFKYSEGPVRLSTLLFTLL